MRINKRKRKEGTEPRDTGVEEEGGDRKKKKMLPAKEESQT